MSDKFPLALHCMTGGGESTIINSEHVQDGGEEQSIASLWEGPSGRQHYNAGSQQVWTRDSLGGTAMQMVSGGLQD